MTPIRPYMIRAFYTWIVDNAMTPYLLVDASVADVRVPSASVQGGRIVLNLMPAAVTALNLGDVDIAFSARFGGRSFDVNVPVTAVLALYARENGQGLSFADEQNGAEVLLGMVVGSQDEQGLSATDQPVKKKPSLRLVT